MTEHCHHEVLPADVELPMCVFLHGFMGDSTDWSGIVERGAMRFECFVPDLPGHGQSTQLQASAYTFEGAVALIAESIRGITSAPVHLVGYSMGGRLAIHLALTYPELMASLVAESTSAGLLEEGGREARLRADGQVAEKLLTVPLDEFLTDWYQQPLFASLSEEQRSSIVSARMNNDPGELAQSLVGMSVAAQPALWDSLGELEMPVTCISGDLDPKYRGLSLRMADLCKRGQAVNVSDAGHNVHVEQPEAFFDILMDHLSGFA
jgi:2-succinyl-6-hydroxy-2,4-cyclohexadiene-1-carboxylate synthase